MGPGGNRPLTVTDEAGAFEFVDLPTGNFSLSADKAGYQRLLDERGITRLPNPTFAPPPGVADGLGSGDRWS